MTLTVRLLLVLGERKLAHAYANSPLDCLLDERPNDVLQLSSLCHKHRCVGLPNSPRALHACWAQRVSAALHPTQSSPRPLAAAHPCSCLNRKHFVLEARHLNLDRELCHKQADGHCFCLAGAHGVQCWAEAP